MALFVHRLLLRGSVRPLHRWLLWLLVAAGALVVLAVAVLAVLIVATSAPEVVPRTVATPNVQVRVESLGDANVVLLGLQYEDSAHPDMSDPPCAATGLWTMQVNPEDVTGYPYASPPNQQDWTRAADVVGVAHAMCTAPIRLEWVGHDRAHPASDRWMALLPVSVIDASPIAAATLRQYVTRHGRQE